MQQQDIGERLSQKLKNRHIQMISIGGAIGTGFFFASASAINMTGPSIILGYLLGGILIYFILRALGEMTVNLPSSGSYIEYAYLYVNKGTGFIAGWNGWTLFTMACMLEVTVASTLLDYWFHLPHWISCLIFLIIFGTINIIGVKFFGELEFWFAGIKVAVILCVSIAGVWLIYTHAQIHTTAISNMQEYSMLNTFFYHGINGFFAAFVIICLSFCGLEFVSIAAGEAKNPTKAIPRAINSVTLRILILYVFTMCIILLMFPFRNITPHTSPFITVFSQLGFNQAAEIINVVIITAALSTLNSCIYVSSRMLYRLSLNKQAPQIFSKVSHNHLPRNATLFTVFIAFLAVIMNYTFPEKILIYLFAVITVAIIISWLIILITHIYFRRFQIQNKHTSGYPSPFFPYTNILAIILLIIVLITMAINPDSAKSVYVGPVWLAFLYVLYKIFSKSDRVKP